MAKARTKGGILPRAPVENLIRSVSQKQGITRVSKEATKEMTSKLEKIALRISKQASILAGHAKRKTIKAKDIELTHIK
jgi:histone H3/H4